MRKYVFCKHSSYFFLSQRPARNQHKTAKPAETSRDQLKPAQNSETGRIQQRPGETSTKPAQNNEFGRDQQRPPQNQHKTANPAETSPGILVSALSVELASSADVYIYIIGAGCWIGTPSKEFSVGVESWIGILNSKQILVVGVVRMHLVSCVRALRFRC